MVQIACVVGARPNFVKMAAVLRALAPRFAAVLIHTGQHGSPEMSGQFFEELELPRPDFHLEVSGGSDSGQIAEVMRSLEPVLLDVRPALVLVVGDVNSTLAAALVSAKLGIPLAHVEAGLRSFDRTMPEETNRILTDVLSEYLFVSESSGVQNLRAEGIPDRRIFFVGNVMIDSLFRFRAKASMSGILGRLGLEPHSYALVTLHRPSNVDDPERLRELLEMVRELSNRLPVVFPVHPRTRQRMQCIGQCWDGAVKVIPPAGYLDFVRLMEGARLVLTDSGGVQEETTMLRIPCLTVRENTERPATVEQGTNRVVGLSPERVLAAAFEALRTPRALATPIPELWDGRAAERIEAVLHARLSRSLPQNKAAVLSHHS